MKMTRPGKLGKPRAGFPTFPPRLEIACAIPTFSQVRRRCPVHTTGRSGRNRTLRALARGEHGTLPGHHRPGYNYCCPAALPMAGFEVTTYGRFWGDHRGLIDIAHENYAMAVPKYSRQAASRAQRRLLGKYRESHSVAAPLSHR
jgi:hypothetical protein